MLPNIIDNISGYHNIADLFANKWKVLYNSVGYCNHDMELLKDRLDSDILNKCCRNICANNQYFTVEEIIEAIKSLKHDKHNGKSLSTLIIFFIVHINFVSV